MKRPGLYKGIRSPVIAVLGMLIFSISLVFLLTLDIRGWVFLIVLPLVFWQTFLYTGLFITVHDSMHRSIIPGRPFLNDLFGTVSIMFYALFSYRKLKAKHYLHHRNPATNKDPDYHDGVNKGFLSWYWRFMRNYLSPFQIIGMALIFNALIFIVGLDLLNVILFWVIPSLGSTFQLFFFGTYLPHREPEGGYKNKYKASSSDLPMVISFLTCFHFGYHMEHHMYPYVQWWRLPWVKERSRNSS